MTRIVSWYLFNFYPRPPRGGRPRYLTGKYDSNPFLSTPSARRATLRRCGTDRSCRNFYPRPPRGGRPCDFTLCCSGLLYFYPRPPRGGRPNHLENFEQTVEFLSTPSARRATAVPSYSRFSRSLFLSTPSARRATSRLRHLLREVDISIHALREEGDPPFL